MPNPILFFFLIGFALSALLVGAVFYFAHKYFKKPIKPIDYELDKINRDKVHFLTFEPICDFNTENKTYAAQSYDWQFHMKQVGKKFNQYQIKNIIFVHGTFAGDDPFDILRIISETTSLSPTMQETIRQILKKSKNSLFKDLGNFDDEYVALIEEAINHSIKCHNFTWSSANHHLARVTGLIELLLYLEEHNLLSKKEGPLFFIGHSHAGQLFALLSQFLHNSQLLSKILEITQYDKDSFGHLSSILKKLNKKKIDIVTLGTPIRYNWRLGKNIRLLNIINHRGSELLGGTPSGALTTRDGDYIQQWGVAGSDNNAVLKEEREINLKLDAYFGIGNQTKVWMNNIKHRKRVPHHGQTLLIDYKDSSKFPNAHQTLFGHGTYTRFQNILFNLETIVRYLYKD